MRKFVFTISFSTLLACNQKEQKIAARYPNGQKMTEYLYSNKKDTSTYVCKVYYETGVLKYETHISGNKFIDEKKAFFENGKLERIEKLNQPTFLYDSLYDCYITNFRADGTKLSEYQYINNEISGLRKDYDSSGNLERTAEYTNDKVNGKEILYFQNGKIKRISFLRNDILNGFDIYFKESGDTLKWFHNGKYGINGMFYKKWLNNSVLTGQYGDSDRSYVIWKWFDKNNKEIKTKVDTQKNENYIAPE